jgi:hypothetical protein
MAPAFDWDGDDTLLLREEAFEDDGELLFSGPPAGSGGDTDKRGAGAGAPQVEREGNWEALWVGG